MPEWGLKALRRRFGGSERMFIHHPATEFPRRPLLGHSCIEATGQPSSSRRKLPICPGQTGTNFPTNLGPWPHDSGTLLLVVFLVVSDLERKRTRRWRSAGV